MEKKPISHFVVGLIIGLVLVATFLIFYFTGRSFEKDALSYIPSLLFVIILIFSIVQYSKANNHNVTFGSCFSYGFKATAIAALIMALFMFIFLYTFPDYKEQFVAFMTEELEKSEAVDDEQKEKTVEMMAGFFTISAIGGSLIANIIVGAIASLIGAAVAKKNPQAPFNQAG
ncbi:MAG TPA: DUF4199 domain-containing protein [Segetibacter sp.]|jgi:uncharacterized membrane protein YphA (DoxX/SURF4 family)